LKNGGHPLAAILWSTACTASARSALNTTYLSEISDK